MYCSKCGKELEDEAMICPQCGCATSNYYKTNTPKGDVNTKDYLKIHEFYQKAKCWRNLGIWATVLMFGIGFIFTIIACIVYRGLKVPVVTTTNVKELAELEEGKRFYKTGRILLCMPILAISICCFIVSISIMASTAGC